MSRTIYISGDVGRSYHHTPYPALKRFVARLVETAPPPIAFRAPKVIEVTAARRGPGELLVHLLNNAAVPLPEDTPQVATHFYVEEVNPIHDIEVIFNAFQVKSARMPLADLELEVVGEPARVTVPRVDLHEVVLVEVEE